MILDCTHAPTVPSNEALELLCKSAEDVGLFQAHPTDVLLAEVENDGTEWMQQALGQVEAVAREALTGVKAGAPVLKAGPDDLGPKCRHLEQRLRAEVPGTLSMDEYLAVIDCWLWKYLAPAAATRQAQRQAVKQYLAGIVRGAETIRTAAAAKDRAATLPTTITEAEKAFRLTALDRQRISVAEASAARHVQGLTARTRSALQDVIIQAERRRLAHGEQSFQLRPLDQQLRDSFGELNRDWRRIAVSETSINASEGYLGLMKPGETVIWMAHPGACRYCESMDGRAFTVVAVTHPRKDPESMVWPGKHAENVGRSISKRKRLDDGSLTDRSADELVVPMIPAHPICRCTWRRGK